MNIAPVAATSDALVLAMQNLTLDPNDLSPVAPYLTWKDLRKTSHVCQNWRQFSLKELSLRRQMQASIFREILSFACAWSGRISPRSFEEINQRITLLKTHKFPSFCDIENLFVMATRSCAAVVDIRDDGHAFRISLEKEIEQRISNQEINLNPADLQTFRALCPTIAQNCADKSLMKWFFTFSEHHKSRSITKRLDLIRSDWWQIGCNNMAQFDIDQTVQAIFNEMRAKRAQPVSFQRFIYSLCEKGEVIHALNVAKSLHDPEVVGKSVKTITEALIRLYKIESAEELIQEFGGPHLSLYKQELFDQYCEKFNIRDPDDILSLLEHIELPVPITGLCMVKALLFRATLDDITIAEKIASKLDQEPERTVALQLVCETMCDNLEIAAARKVVKKIFNKEMVQYLSTQIIDASTCVRKRNLGN